METKDKSIDSSNLENVEEIEPKVKKKSLIKFIHVFESNVERMPAIRKSRKKNLRRNSDRNYNPLKRTWQVADSYNNPDRNYNPLERIWQVADSYYYLNPSKLSF